MNKYNNWKNIAIAVLGTAALSAAQQPQKKASYEGIFSYAEVKQFIGSFGSGFAASIGAKTIDRTSINLDKNVPGVVGIAGAAGLFTYFTFKKKERAKNQADSHWDTLFSGSVSAIAGSLGYVTGTAAVSIGKKVGIQL